MTVTISGITNGDRTITFEKTAASDKILAILDDCVHYLFDAGYGDHGTDEEPRTYDDQTTNEKLDMLDKHITRVIKEAAETFHVNDSVRVARETAIADSDFDLGQGII